MRIIEYTGCVCVGFVVSDKYSRSIPIDLTHINTYYTAYKQSQTFENILQFIDQTMVFLSMLLKASRVSVYITTMLKIVEGVCSFKTG